MKPLQIAAQSVLLVFMAVSAVFVSPKTSHGQCIAPAMKWQKPVLVSGSADSINAIYRFQSVTPGVYADVKVLNIVGGATLRTIDDSTYGYSAAWQPIVNTPSVMGAGESYVSFEIKFRDSVNGNSHKYNCYQLSFIDVDGDGQHVKEFVAVKNPSFFTTAPVCVLNISNIAGGIVKAVGPVSNYYNIDTSAWATNINYTFINSNKVNEVRVGSITDSLFVPQERLTCGYFAQLSIPLTVLPVTYTSFTGALDENTVAHLTWTTSSELNNDHFEIERSLDGLSFSFAGTVKASTASGITDRKYNFTDAAAVLKTAKKVYYRIRQIDTDGRATTGSVVVLQPRTSGHSSLLSVYPVPVKSNFTVAFNAERNDAGIFQIKNLFGQKVYEKKVAVAAGQNAIAVSDAANLLPGNYVAVLMIPGADIQIQKFIK